MLDERVSRNKYLITAAVAVLISIVYWSAFGSHALATYHEYSDLGTGAFDMYYHLAYPSVFHGLQYLVFENHISPDQILVMLAYAVAPSALTLLVVQAIAVSLAGLVVFFIGRHLLKSDRIGLLLCLAFLLNPGIQGIMVFDYHAEMMIPLFFLLTFYFLVRRKKYAFAASLLLLLGIIEVTSFVAIAFGATMAIYAVLREKDRDVRKSWLIYSGVAIVASVLVFGFYGFAANSLNHAYLAGKYVGLPQSSKLPLTNSQEIHMIGQAFAPGGALSQYFTYWQGYLLFSLAIVFLGFGVAGLFDPLFAVLFVAPWLFEVFVVGDIQFIFTWNQYFAYAAAGSVIVTVLALRNLTDNEETKNLLSFLKHRNKVKKYLVASIPVCAVLLFLVSPHFLYSKNVNNLQQDLLFQMTPGEKQQIQQLTSMIDLVPKNASLMAPYFAMPELFQRKYFELLSDSANGDTVLPSNTPGVNVYGMWFQPDYVLADFNPYISLNAGNGDQIPNFVNITGATIVNGSASFNGPYGIYAYNGTALLLKRR